MNGQQENNNKIGARCLSDLEAELILPTYQRIYYQIDQFRKEKNVINRLKRQGASNQDKTQKTNNIGIIGVRGAGKTSILKTIQMKLQRKIEKQDREAKRNDIIFPIIVPENMSESGTLMATILGMLGEVVEEREKEEEKKGKRYNGDCIRKTSLRLKYDEVVKQYTYIQKEYRDILIRQYTTENAYVSRSSKVFNSDTEFINKFDDLIDELVNPGKQEDNSNLLFLFIDDIDLSTYRCADVVKTLLSYLSNENIVTFISGDLDTFEEALTLDFLRQENVLDKGILEQEIGKDKLLVSKKILAYEYLKKIIPPAYRYNIKYWSLEEMGNYCIADLADQQVEDGTEKDHQGKHSQKDGRQKAGVTMSALLTQALKGWVDPAFFCYVDEEYKDSENEIQTEGSNAHGKTQKVWKALPYTYYIFDHTSRGLNNVYNVLNEIAESREEGKTDDLKEKKLLLDTIVSSKKVYNDHRNEIQQNFFHVGVTKADCQVFFDNAKAIIYKKKEEKNTKNSSQNQAEYQIANPVERFSLFILVDFAARLLYEGDYQKQVKEDTAYKILKQEAIKDLFFHPIIAEKVMDVTNYGWENKEMSKDGKNLDLKLKDMKLQDLNISFLLKGDLVLNLAYYKNLPLEEMLKIYEAPQKERTKKSNIEAPVTVELEQSTVIAIWKAFSSIAGINAEEDVSKVIAGCYSVFWKEFAYIRNRTSSSVTQNIARRLFDKEINDVLEKSQRKAVESDAEQKEEQSEGQKDQQREEQKKRVQRAQMGRILSNTLARALKAKGEDAIEDRWKEILFGKQYVVLDNKGEIEVEKDSIDEKKIKRRVDILKIIDEKGLWQAEVTESVAEYLKEAVGVYLEYMKDSMEGEEWELNTSGADDSWEKFKKADKGVSATKAKTTFRNVKKILEAEGKEKFTQGMLLETYQNVISELEDLAGNYRVWYGRTEAQEILNKLQEASAEPNAGWDIWIEKHSYFAFLLQCLYKYKMEVEENDNIRKNASLLADITRKLSMANKEADRQTLESFIGELNQDLTDTIDSEEFEELFS